MAKIRHINCPKCGGTMGTSTMDRVVKCRYCGIWSLVEVPGFVPEYYVKPMLDEVSARRKIQAFLRDDEMPEGLIKQARFHSARLYFIPYHEMQGRRVGTMVKTDFEPIGPARMVRETYVGPGGITVSTFRESTAMVPKEKKVDTRVVLADFTRLEPAVILGEWGLEDSDINNMRSDPAGALQPMNRRKMEKQGKVYDPTIRPDQMIQKLETRAGTAWLDDDTEICEVRVKRIYYPVWRVRYRYQGRLYGVSIDGVSGKFMAARAPQNDRYRVYWMLGTSALVAFIVGKISRSALGALFFELLRTSSAGHTQTIAAYMVILGIVGIILALIIMGFGWEQFRYAGEIVIKGEKRTVEKINRPEHTLFDSIMNFLGDMLGSIPRPREYR